MTTPSLPPGPPIGLFQTFRYLRDPYDFFASTRARYGDVFTAGLFGAPMVIVGSPAGAQQVYSADPETFVHLATESLAPLVGRRSLLVLTGARHRRERKLLMPAFHGDRMRAYGATIQTAARAAAATWSKGQTFAFGASAQEISLQVIVRAVFGVTDPVRAAAVREAVIGLVEATSPLVIGFPVLHRPWFPPFRRLVRARAALTGLLDEEIAARRAAEAGDDILSLLLAARHEDGAAMSREELHDELVTLLFAGHETTGVALSWALYWLLRDPPRMARLLAELDAAGTEPEAVAKLPFLEAVVHETLRLHPIVPDVHRKLARPLEVGGFTLPAGVGISVATALLHTRPEVYPEPQAFRPERFLERRFSAFEFTPYGGGARRCLGAALANYEIKLALAELLGRHRFALAEPGEVRPGRRTIVLGPATGVRVTYEGPRG